jgi:hypothetical protein
MHDTNVCMHVTRRERVKQCISSESVYSSLIRTSLLVCLERDRRVELMGLSPCKLF